MKQDFINEYSFIRAGGIGFYEQKRGIIAVWGKEAVPFLNGMITNDTAKLEDGSQMSAAFPNAQGRLLAIVRVLRRGDKFFFETEAATREKIFNNLFRFTFAGDFFVEDLSENYRYFEIPNSEFVSQSSDSIIYESRPGTSHFVSEHSSEMFIGELEKANAVKISDDLYEVLRVENGTPLYGVDADETTIVPELGIENLISYQKGCYVGQEIIARIHFRGHIAKQLTGLVLEVEAEPGDEIKSLDGKNAGKITSVTFSPTLERYIALAFVRYDYLAEGTKLKIGDAAATVKDLPFIGQVS